MTYACWWLAGPVDIESGVGLQELWGDVLLAEEFLLEEICYLSEIKHLNDNFGRDGQLKEDGYMIQVMNEWTKSKSFQMPENPTLHFLNNLINLLLMPNIMPHLLIKPQLYYH